MMDKNTRVLINPTGRFVIGGPHGDAGVTGRKIIVDTYGGAAPHGGGAFSGKDPTKVDRSACYMARYVAKNVVAVGLAERCLVQLAYAIGVAEPVSVLIDTYDTGLVDDEKISEIVRAHFKLTPHGIIETLDLRRPIYKKTAAFGHFGRSEAGVHVGADRQGERAPQRRGRVGAGDPKAYCSATAAIVAAVIFFLLATLPAAPRAASWPGDPACRPARSRARITSTPRDRTDRGDRAAVAAAAARAGLAFVIVTDHGDGTRTPDPPAYIGGVLCLDGVEISTTGGHYVALGLGPAPYPLGGAPSAVVEDVARLGGFGIAAHPDSPRPELAWTDWDAPIDGIEWLNGDSEWRDESRARLGARAVRLRAAAGTGARVDPRPAGENPGALGRADVAAPGRRDCRRRCPRRHRQGSGRRGRAARGGRPFVRSQLPRVQRARDPERSAVG